MIKNALTTALLGAALAMSGAALAESKSADAAHVAGENADLALGATTVLGAVRALGMDATAHRDSGGDPHFVITSKVGEAKEVAVFMDDCGSKGCEDLVLYAAFPANKKLGDSVLNEWNHITSKLRSKAARSGNGEISISMPVSFLDSEDQRELSMLIGLFVVEANFMSATLNKHN